MKYLALFICSCTNSLFRINMLGYILIEVMIMDISLKNIVLAGIGSIAYSYDKCAEIVEDLVKKGELTVKQGVELNEELKQSKKGSTAANENAVQEKAANETINNDMEKFKEMILSLNLATKEDLSVMEERIKRLEES